MRSWFYVNIKLKMMIGKKIFESYEGMTITSGNSTVKKVYVIRERTLNGYKAELIDTNASMYSGEGVFKEFKNDTLNSKNLPYQYNVSIF